MFDNADIDSSCPRVENGTNDMRRDVVVLGIQPSVHFFVYVAFGQVVSQHGFFNKGFSGNSPSFNTEHDIVSFVNVAFLAFHVVAHGEDYRCDNFSRINVDSGNHICGTKMLKNSIDAYMLKNFEDYKAENFTYGELMHLIVLQIIPAVELELVRNKLVLNSLVYGVLGEINACVMYGDHTDLSFIDDDLIGRLIKGVVECYKQVFNSDATGCYLEQVLMQNLVDNIAALKATFEVKSMRKRRLLLRKEAFIIN
jgi:hypothetical protein